MINLKTLKHTLMPTTLLTVIFLSGCQSMNLGEPTNLSDIFNKQPEVQPRYVPDIVTGELYQLTIHENRISCNSIKPMQCMLATINQQSPVDSTQPVNNMDDIVIQISYDGIEGFTPQPNMTYKLTARPLIDSNKGQPTGYWRLENILSQMPKK